MSEDENKAEPVPQKLLGHDPNVGMKQRLKELDCNAGEAILAIKVSCSADSEGTKIGIGISTIGPDLKKVKSLISGFLTMAAHNIAVAIRDAIKPFANEEFALPVLMATENEFAEAVSHKQPKEDTPEEVPHGV